MLSYRRTFDAITNSNWDKTQSKQRDEEETLLTYLSKEEIERSRIYEEQSFSIAIGLFFSIIFLIFLILV
ncbi:hypothetical protein BK010_05905 [Tenericutes bacterium MO-XQ]|nr:hypothetical protein BK010_05905 [Tenericutes bacterium MO-XQ]